MAMEIEEALINEVKNHVCLYDLASPLYKNMLMKEAAWEEIGRNIGLDGEKSRKKWKVLRDTFRRSKRNGILASGSGAPSLIRKKWRHHDAMRFLDGVQASRSTIGNMTQEEENCDSPPPCDHEVGSASTSTPCPSTSSSRPTSRTANRTAARCLQMNNELMGNVFTEISSAAQKLSERLDKRHGGRVELAFSGLAQTLKAAGMPEEMEVSVIDEVQAVVFGAVRNWNRRNIERN